jgi:hypothetical protein
MTDNTQVEQSATTETSLADMSLADYRAARENAGSEGTPAAAKSEPATEEPAAGASTDDAGESDADEGAAEDSTEQAKPDDKKPAKKGGFQRTIEKKDREIEQLKQQLAAKPAAPAAPAAETKQEPKAAEFVYDKPKPKLEDFGSLEDHIEALSDWKADERDAKRAHVAAQEQAQTEAQKVLDGWNSRQAEAKQAHSDYDEVIQSVSDIPLSPAHQRVILESEHGPEIAYQLAQDPAELKKFAAMSPLAAARYFGKLEAQHTPAAAPPKETKVSQAPRPIKPVGAGKGGAASTFDVSKASLSDYRRRREQGLAIA